MPEADADVIDIATFIGHDNPDAAARFVQAFKTTVQQLARHPHRGVPMRTIEPQLFDVRWTFVRGFRHYLVFHMIGESNPTLTILRVIHGARDVSRELMQ